jgi:hypothetical protein
MPSAQVADAKRLTYAIRCANHKYLIADLHLVRVAERRGRNTFRHFFELQQRHIRLNVRADHAGVDYLAVRKLDAGNIRGLHYVRCC